MRQLQKHIGNGTTELDTAGSRRQDFLLTRHFIGRLGSHFKAARILTMAARRLPDLFDNFTIEPRPSPKPPYPPPPIDSLTTLSGILNRMLPKGSENKPLYEEALETMNIKFNLQAKLFEQYQDKEFRPRVHAELQLLEYFYNQGLQFVDDDRFIGCSKPACYCCYLYIKHHPGDFVLPESHGIRYINWRVPDLANEGDQTEKNHQRDVLNKVIEKIRRDALRQIDQRGDPRPWRPDSTTGITGSQEDGHYDTLEAGMYSGM